MGDVTGPISTLPGAGHDFPDGTLCDDHPDRKAVARIQGETDSFGSELIDMCQECLDQHRAYMRSPEATAGRCDWCKKDATDLRPRRDIDEGMAGPVYEVCGACAKKYDAQLEEELRAYDNDYDDFDDYDFDDEDDGSEECGRWCNGRLIDQCSKAGSEECDWECPIGLPHRNKSVTR